MKNKTSIIGAHRSISRIEELLCKNGAIHTMRENSGGRVMSLAFTVVSPDGGKHAVRLSANSDAIAAFMKKKIKKPHKDTMRRIEEQAERTAWKLLLEDLEIQISRIEVGQIDFLQAFVGGLMLGKTTIYEAYRDGQIKALKA